MGKPTSHFVPSSLLSRCTVPREQRSRRSFIHVLGFLYTASGFGIIHSVHALQEETCIFCNPHRQSCTQNPGLE